MQRIATIEVEFGQTACCPPQKYTSWDEHPRVYIDIKDGTSGFCPYCGTRFIVKTK
jgi:uncharacterized Zn-finger protein